MKEIWKSIENFPGYEVSSLGKVRSSKSRRTLKAYRTAQGYLGVQLYAGSKASRKNKTIHVLVLEAFGGPRPKGYEAGHLDDDPKNNRLDNLAWITVCENKLMMYEKVRRKLRELDL